MANTVDVEISQNEKIGNVNDLNVPWFLKTIRRLYLSGGLPLVIYKILLRFIPASWMPTNVNAIVQVTVEGHKKSYIVNLDDTIGKETYLMGWYDKPILDFTRKLVQALPKPTMNVYVDIGANIGNHTVYLNDLFDQVISLEPNGRAYDQLGKNVSLLNARHIDIHKVGLSDKKAELSFAIQNKNNLGSARIVDASKGQFTIDVERGDDFLADKIKGIVQLIKIDVEGHETNIFRGMAGLIDRHLPIIMFEYSDDTIRNNGVEIMEVMKLHGYKFYGTKYSSPREQVLTMMSKMYFYKFDFLHRCETVYAIPEQYEECFQSLIKSRLLS